MVDRAAVVVVLACSVAVIFACIATDVNGWMVHKSKVERQILRIGYGLHQACQQFGDVAPECHRYSCHHRDQAIFGSNSIDESNRPLIDSKGNLQLADDDDQDDVIPTEDRLAKISKHHTARCREIHGTYALAILTCSCIAFAAISSMILLIKDGAGFQTFALICTVMSVVLGILTISVGARPLTYYQTLWDIQYNGSVGLSWGPSFTLFLASLIIMVLVAVWQILFGLRRHAIGYSVLE